MSNDTDFFFFCVRFRILFEAAGDAAVDVTADTARAEGAAQLELELAWTPFLTAACG